MLQQHVGTRITAQETAQLVAPQRLHAFLGARQRLLEAEERLAVGVDQTQTGGILFAQRNQVAGATVQDGDQADVLDAVRVVAIQNLSVVLVLLEELHQIDVAIVFVLVRALGRIDQPGIATHVFGIDRRHASQRAVPLGAVVHARFPRVITAHAAGVFRITIAVEPQVVADDAGQDGGQFFLGKPAITPFLEQQLHDAGQHRRLGDGAGRRAVLDAPDFRPREVGFRVTVEDDVRHHAVVPLAFQQALDFTPGTRLVTGGQPAQRGDGGVPVPLEGVEATSGYGVAAQVVELENVVSAERVELGIHVSRLRSG